MNGSMTARRLYLELTALFIDQEIAKFRRGEQGALVSFTNVVKLATKELTAPGASQRVKSSAPGPRADLHRHSA
jgi:hypothetical protein